MPNRGSSQKESRKKNGDGRRADSHFGHCGLVRRRRDGGYRVETRGREAIAYWEGERAYLFDAAWGARQPVLYVPSPRSWDDVVPSWLRGRRDEVVERLRRRSRHVIEETDEGYSRRDTARELRPIESADEAFAIATAFLDAIPGIVGPWETATFVEARDGWRLEYLYLDPEAFAPALPGGRGALLVRRDTGEVVVLPAAPVD
jgi:hypothetical protein